MKNNYPNKLEKICGAIFLASALATGISVAADINSKSTSQRTWELYALTFISGAGAFRREDYLNDNPSTENYK